MHRLVPCLILLLSCTSEDFVVGGVATGLEGDSVVLNLGQQRLEVAQSGPFTFAEPLPDGAEWEVSLTVPARHHECELTGDQGRIDGGDIDSISLSCTPLARALVLRVEGLEGTLELDLDGERLTFSEDGLYPLRSEITQGIPYALEILSEPLAQSCRSPSLQGEVGSADVLISIRCSTAYSLGAHVSGLEGRSIGVELVSIGAISTSDGTFTFDHKFIEGDRWQLRLTDLPEQTGCRALPASGRFEQGDIQTRLPCVRLISWGDEPAPAQVVGQPDRSSVDPHRGGEPWADTFAQPSGAPLWVGEHTFIADATAHRVLIFEGVPSDPSTTAVGVLGQHSFDAVEASSSVGGLREPVAVASDGSGLVIVERGNHRLSVWSTLPLPAASSDQAQGDSEGGFIGPEPDLILGQSDPDSTEPGGGAGRLSAPSSAQIAAGWLWVADTGNHRVLGWRGLPTEHRGPDVVLGQISRSSCEPNRGESELAPDRLLSPSDVAWDGERLVVADTGNRRVLIWNGAPTEHGAPADLVLGQVDLSSRFDDEEPLSADRLAGPTRVLATGHQLLVTDGPRLLLWNSAPSESGTPADGVLGVPSFDSDLPFEDPALGPRAPSGASWLRGELLISDSLGARVLLYDGAVPQD